MIRFPDSLGRRIEQRGSGLLGTWVKLPTFETLQMLAGAGFEAVVIDMEHAPHSLSRAVELLVCAQAAGMLALVRLPDASGTTVQPLLDGGADGLLVPRVSDPATAHSITRRMIFAPDGERGLGATSRAGRWGLGEKAEYLAKGMEIARFVQLEDWHSLERASEFAAVKGVGGLFVGHGDLSLSSGRPADSPEVVRMTKEAFAAAHRAGKFSGVAVGSPKEARRYLDEGVSLVMLSNDATMFGQAARRMAAGVLAN